MVSPVNKYYIQNNLEKDLPELRFKPTTSKSHCRGDRHVSNYTTNGSNLGQTEVLSDQPLYYHWIIAVITKCYTIYCTLKPVCKMTSKMGSYLQKVTAISVKYKVLTLIMSCIGMMSKLISFSKSSCSSLVAIRPPDPLTCSQRTSA